MQWFARRPVPGTSGAGSWLNRGVEIAHPLLERAHQAPEAPGVYQFQDAKGKVLYVGKAKHLRRRVLSYFSRRLEPRLVGMLARARGLEFVVTGTEVEALILENRLIKRHRPRYNVLLRDDKTYPYVKLTTGEAWPRAYLTRRVLDDGHSYFGPYLGHGMAARVMDLIRTRTQVRTCTIEIDGSLPRPCLYHGMGACLGPCVSGLTTPEEYARAVEEVTLLLEGRHQELRPRLEAQMWRAAEAHEFERAARYRDLVRALDELSQAQNVEIAGSGSVDVIGVEGDGRDASAVVLIYRDGQARGQARVPLGGAGRAGRRGVPGGVPRPVLRGQPGGARARRGAGRAGGGRGDRGVPAAAARRPGTARRSRCAGSEPGSSTWRRRTRGRRSGFASAIPRHEAERVARRGRGGARTGRRRSGASSASTSRTSRGRRRLRRWWCGSGAS